MVELLLVAVLLVTATRIVWRDITTLRIARFDSAMLVISGLLHSTSTRPTEIVLDVATAVGLVGAVIAVQSGYRHLRGIEAIGLGDAWIMMGATFWVGAPSIPSYLALSSTATLGCVLLQKRWTFSRERLRAFAGLRIPFGATLAIMIPTMMIIRHVAS